MGKSWRDRVGSALIQLGERLSSGEKEFTVDVLAHAPPPNVSAAVDDDDDGKRDQVRQLIKQALDAPSATELARFLDFTTRFRRLSVWNTRMAYIQRPGAAALASEAEWQRIGRYVLPDAVPILILWPFSPIRHVFELADTGPPINRDAFNDPFATAGLLQAGAVKTLEQRLKTQKNFRIDIELRRQGFNYAGSASPQGSLALGDVVASPVSGEAPFGQFASQNAAHEVVPDKIPKYRITVNDRLTHEERFVTLCHELGHIFCGHLGACLSKKNEDESGWPDRRGLPKGVREIEAEAVAFLVAARAGLTTRSADYLKGYANAEQIAKVDVDIVVRAAARIERLAKLSYGKLNMT